MNDADTALHKSSAGSLFLSTNLISSQPAYISKCPSLPHILVPKPSIEAQAFVMAESV